jgi:hypothetical protein
MAFPDLRPASGGSPRSLRRTWAVPLSLALHGAAFYAIGVVPWAASEMPEPPAPQNRVVWVKDWPPPRDSQPPEERALDPTGAAARPEVAAEASSTPPPRTANVAPPPRKPPTPPIEPQPAPRPESPQRDAGAAANSSDGAGPASTVPKVDWEKERHDAVREVLNERAQQREYLTFTLDDLVPKPEPVDPVPPPLVVDNCVVVTGKLQRFAALMMGRCVREARGDLFAAIKPAYLKTHPVCIETRPENPGSFLSDGRQISTVKCELVANDEK